MRTLGWLFTRLGLGLPLVAILLQLAEQISVGQMLVVVVAALCLFYIGRIIEGYSR